MSLSKCPFEHFFSLLVHKRPKGRGDRKLMGDNWELGPDGGKMWSPKNWEEKCKWKQDWQRLIESIIRIYM